MENGIENGNSCSSDSAHLVGWGGDTFQLLQDIKNEGENMEKDENQTEAENKNKTERHYF